MLRKLILFIFCFYSLCSWSQSNYFKVYRKNISKLPVKEQIDSALKLPFDVMNSQTSEAIQFYENALIQAKELNDFDLIGDCYDKLGLAYYYKGDYEISVESTLAAIKYFEKSKNKQKLGEVYAALGYQMKRRNLVKAFEYMRKGLHFLKKIEKNHPFLPLIIILGYYMK